MTERKLNHGRCCDALVGLRSSFKAEIVSLRDCLAERHFIPDMQRQYEWDAEKGKKHVLNLWRSLLDFDVNDPDHTDEYYTGTLICYKEGDKWSVIDGQQRLTSLSLMFIAIRDSISNEHFLHEGTEFKINGESKSIREIVKVISKETLGSKRYPRLMPKDLNAKRGAINSKSFVWHLNEIPRPDIGHGISNANAPFKVNQAYRMFMKKIKENFDLTSKEGVNGLIKFYVHVLSGVVFNRTVVADMAQGYRIFSTENTTGLALNHMDITRALLLGQIDRARLKSSMGKVKSNMASMNRGLESSPRSVKDHFIRMSWVIKKGTPMPKTKLLNSINSEIKALNSDSLIQSFSRKLSRQSNCYVKKILQPPSSDSHYRQHQDLKDCGFRQHFPLLMALLLRDKSSEEEDEVRETLEIVETIYVRYILVGGMRPGTFEQMFASWSKKATEVDNLQKLIVKMKSDVADVNEPEMFNERFSEISPNEKVKKYILSKIERRHNDSVNEISDFKNARVCAIIPNYTAYSNLPEEWQSLCDSDTFSTGLTSKIGNWFLIQNVRASMYPVSETSKQQNERLLENAGKFHYSKSTIEGFNGLFYSTHIQSRGESLSETADKIWKLF